VADGNLHLVVKGRVQGVGFRWFVVAAGKRLDLAGWVKNLDDGSLEVHAAGPPEALKELEALITMGPSGARVAQVVRIETSARAELERPFRVSR
jgi:acylphosphatase